MIITLKQLKTCSFGLDHVDYQDSYGIHLLSYIFKAKEGKKKIWVLCRLKLTHQDYVYNLRRFSLRKKSIFLLHDFKKKLNASVDEENCLP